MTIFNTPILTPVLRWLAKRLLYLSGWRVEGLLPFLPKFVLVAAPHTSNWDFMLMLAFGLVLRANLHYMGKAELFRPPFGFFFKWCGGIPVHRGKSNGLVEQMVKRFAENERYILAIAPEGTREKAREWKSGFYHIARGADVPMVGVYVDAKAKAIGVGKTFAPSANTEADISAIRSVFTSYQGIHPWKGLT